MDYWADRPRDGGPAHKLVRQDGDASPEFWDWRYGMWVENDVLRGDLMMDMNLDLIGEDEVPAAQAEVRGVNSGALRP